MALKRPNMNEGSKKERCCNGKNAGKLYETKDPCPDDKVFSKAKCDCIECKKTEDCQQKGYPGCYVCEDGECVEGPTCCSNLPGTQMALACGAEVTESSCCVYPRRKMQVYKPETQCWGVARWYGCGSACPSCTLRDTGGSTDTLTLLSCEEIVITVSEQTVGPMYRTSCCCDDSQAHGPGDGEYNTNVNYITQARSPAGLRNVGGASGRCEPFGIRGSIGPYLQLPRINDAYYGGFWCDNIPAPEISEAPEGTCGDGSNDCGCSGQEFVLMSNGDIPWNTSCGICSGLFVWGNIEGTSCKVLVPA